MTTLTSVKPRLRSVGAEHPHQKYLFVETFLDVNKISIKKGNLKTTVAKQHWCLLSSTASLGPSAGYSALEELLLRVEEDDLVAGYGVHSLPEFPAKGVLVKGDHRHLVVDLPG